MLDVVIVEVDFVKMENLCTEAWKASQFKIFSSGLAIIANAVTATAEMGADLVDFIIVMLPILQ